MQVLPNRKRPDKEGRGVNRCEQTVKTFKYLFIQQFYTYLPQTTTDLFGGLQKDILSSPVWMESNMWNITLML